jgi:MFS family permease
VLAPLSEMYGRRPVYIGSILVFLLLVLPCALATSLTEILVVRFFGYVGIPPEIAITLLLTYPAL